MDCIIYHSRDLDGITSGALGHISYMDDKPELIGFDYGQNLDIRKFRGKEVLMVDVSLPMDRMFQLANIASKLIFVDHHKSAFDQFIELCTKNNLEIKETKLNGLINEYSSPDLKIVYYYSEQLSACEIMLSLFIDPNTLSGNSKNMVRLLGQYDTWRNTSEKMLSTDDDWYSMVLPFQWGLRDKRDPIKVSDLLLNYPERFFSIVQEGRSILSYQKSIDKSMLSRNGFEFDLHISENESIKVLALNGGPFNSMTFESQWYPEIHDAMMPFVYDGKTNKWTFSLYTTKDEIDILSIAKSFGGGGHKQACGFQLGIDEVEFSEKGIIFKQK